MQKLFKSKKNCFLTVVCAMAVAIVAIWMVGLSGTKSGDFLSKNVAAPLSQRMAQQSSIPIAMAADDNYTYPTIVSITSLMINSNEETNYDIYIMTQGGFAEENKQKLLSLQAKYGNRCKINLIDMQDNYENANVAGHGRTPLSTPAYYRLSLSSLLPKLDKIIWLDGDTLVFDDLTSLFNISMEGLYYRGFLDYPYPMECFNFNGDHYICSGVMLINLEKLRRDNMETQIATFIVENNDKLVQHDQTVINVLFEKNIGALPPKYCIFNFADMEMVEDYSNRLVAENRYTKDEILDAYNNPVILHYVYKPWTELESNRKALWWEYAAKTDYFEEIKAKYNLT